VDAPLGKIDEVLASGRPVICKVDYSPQAGLQEHWVLIIGKDTDYLINDPFTGETYWFEAKIGNPLVKIFKIVVYNGKIPETPVNDTETLTAENTKLRQQLADEIKLVGELRNKIVGLEQDAEGREKELEELHSRNRTLEIENSNYKNEIGKFKGDIDVLATSLTQLQGDYRELQSKKVEEFSTEELIKLVLRRIFGRR